MSDNQLRMPNIKQPSVSKIDDDELEMKTIIIDPSAGIPVGQVVYRCALCRKICESPHMATLHYQVDHIEVHGVTNQNHSRASSTNMASSSSKTIAGTSLLANNNQTVNNNSLHHNNNQRNHPSNAPSGNRSNHQQQQHNQRYSTNYNTQTKSNINNATNSRNSGGGSSSISNINTVNRNAQQQYSVVSNNTVGNTSGKQNANIDRVQSRSARDIELARRNIYTNVNTSATRPTNKTLVRSEKRKPNLGQSPELPKQQTIIGEIAENSTSIQVTSSIASLTKHQTQSNDIATEQSCSLTTNDNSLSIDKQKTLAANKIESTSFNTPRRGSKGSPESVSKDVVTSKHATRYSTSRNQPAPTDMVHNNDATTDNTALKTLRTRNSVYSLEKRASEQNNHAVEKNEETIDTHLTYTMNQDDQKHDDQQKQIKIDANKSLRSQSANRVIDKTDGAKTSVVVSPTTSADSSGRKRPSNRSSSLNSSRRNSFDSANGLDANSTLLADNQSKNTSMIEKTTPIKSGKKRRGARRWTVKKKKSD